MCGRGGGHKPGQGAPRSPHKYIRVYVCAQGDPIWIRLCLFHMWNLLFSAQDKGAGGGMAQDGKTAPLLHTLTHPRGHPHRLESVRQLPPTVPTLSCCQFVSFPANPSFFFFLWGKLSRKDRGHEVWGPSAPPPPILNLLFFQNPKKPEKDPLILTDCGKDDRVSTALRPWWSLTPKGRKFLALLLPPPRPSSDVPYSPSPLGVS